MRRVNLPVVIAIAVVFLGIVLGIPLLHRYQVRRNAEGMLKQASQKIEEGDDAEAIAILTRYVTLRPDDAEQYAQLARILLRRAESGQANVRELRAAAAALEVAVRKNPDDHELRDKLATFLSAVGDFDSALDHLGILRENLAAAGDGSPTGGEATGVDLEKIDVLYATTAARARRTDEAERALAALVGYDLTKRSFDPEFNVRPGRVEAYVFLASLLEGERREVKRADAVLERMVEVYPDDPRAWRLMALWQMDHTRMEAALAAAERAITLDPEDTAAAMVVLRASVALEQLDRADAILAGPLRDAPVTEALVTARADLARARGDFDGTLSILKEGLEAMPDNAMLMTAILAILADLQRGDDLRAALADYKPKLPKDVPAVMYAEGMIAMQEQRWVPALQIWENLRPLVAADATLTRRVDLALARCHAALGQSDQATDARTRAFAAVPGSAAARLMEMGAHETAGRWDEASTIAEELAAIVPKDKLASAPELWRPLFRLRLIDQARRAPDKRDWKKVDELIELLGASPDLQPAIVDRLRIDAQAAKGDRDAAIEASAAAVAANPDEPGLLAQRVILLVAAGRSDEGRALLDSAAAALRDSAEVLGAEIDLASASPAEESVRWLDDVEQRASGLTGPVADRLQRQLITVHVARGGFADARRIAEKLIARDPDDLPVREMILDLADEQDDVAMVTAQAGEIARITGRDNATGRVAQAVARIVAVRAGRRARVAEDVAAGTLTADDRRSLEEARALLTEAAAQRPRWSEIPRQMAAIAELQGDSGAAIGLLRQAVDLREAVPFARRKLALLLAAAGRLDEARPVIESLGNAGGPAVDRLRAEWLAATGDTENAIAIADRLTPDDCSDASQLLWHAALLARCGRLAEAQAICTRATEAAPGKTNAWLMLVRLKASSADPAGAAKTIDAARAALQGPARDRFELLADGLVKKGFPGTDEGPGEIERLEETCRAAIAADADDLGAARRLVEILFRRQRMPEAIEQLRRIVALESARDTTTIIWARRMLASQLVTSRGYRDFQEALALLGQNVDERGVQLTEDLAMSVNLLLQRDEPASWRQALSMLDSLATRRALGVDERVMQARLQAKLNPKLKTKARDELIAIAATSESSNTVVAALVEMLLDGNDPTMAKRWIEKLRAVAPDAPATLRLDAKLALAQNDRDEASRIIAKLIPDEPVDARNAQRMLTGAEIAEQLGFPEVAERVFADFATLSPDGAVLHARALGRRHQTTEAIEQLESVREKISVTMFLDALSAVLRGRSGSLDEETLGKIDRWISAARRENPDSPDVEIQTALLADLLGRSDDAIRSYRDLLASNKLSQLQSGIVAGNLAWLLARPETADEASELVDRSIRELGPHPDVLDTRALVRLARGQTILALEDMDDALLSPTPIKYIHLAAIRVAANDIDGASAALEQSREAGLADLQLTAEEAARVEKVEAAIAARRGES